MSEIFLNVACTVAIGENVEEMIEQRRSGVAFQMGAMGSAKTNFYNDAFKRAGFTDDALAIQQLWKAGKREEAARRVPDAMVPRTWSRRGCRNTKRWASTALRCESMHLAGHELQCWSRPWT
jgi:hypothetical protein